MKIFTLLAILLLLSGCAFTPQTVNLNPQVPLASSSVGSGKTVSLKVLDERVDRGLGHRGGGFGDSAEISSGQIVSQVIFGKISNGLDAKGFKTKRAQGKPDRMLKAEIREIKYHSATGLVTFTIKAYSAIKGICENGENSYERLYRGEVKEEWLVVPFAENNEQMINQSLSEVLGQMLNDSMLIDCLAS